MGLKRKTGGILMILGLLFLTASVVLLVYNRYEASAAEEASAEALTLVTPVIEFRSQQANADNSGYFAESNPIREPSVSMDTVTPADPRELTAVTVEGRTYIGVLYIPDLGLELPVLSSLSEENLELSPCYYYGSAITEDLVIGAHNYISHFARIWRLKPGAQVIFINMNGYTGVYEVALVETLSRYANESLCDGEYPLTLFTCTYGGNDRTAVRCVLSE